MLELPDSSCQCSKPPGCYGTGGRHFALVDEKYVADQIRRFEALARMVREGDPPTGATRGGIFYEHAASAEFWRANGHHYLGQSIAYEQCPAYLARVRRGIEEKKARATAATGQGNSRDIPF